VLCEWGRTYSATQQNGKGLEKSEKSEKSQGIHHASRLGLFGSLLDLALLDFLEKGLSPQPIADIHVMFQTSILLFLFLKIVLKIDLRHLLPVWSGVG
jgi:hypothetical protein